MSLHRAAPARQRAPPCHAQAPADLGTPSSWSSTTRGDNWPITCSTWGRERANTAGGGREGPAEQIARTPPPHRPVYLSGALEIALPEARRRFDKTRVFRLRGARGNISRI